MLLKSWLNENSEGSDITLQDLADEFGVSAERIRQIEAKAFEKLRLALTA